MTMMKVKVEQKKDECVNVHFVIRLRERAFGNVYVESERILSKNDIDTILKLVINFCLDIYSTDKN
jgi:hypothetical protein